MTTNDDALARRAAQVEAEAKANGGEDTWKGIMKSLEQKIARGDMAPTELGHKLTRPNAASEIFNSSIADTDEATWRAWRDAQPKRKARIDGAKR